MRYNADGPGFSGNIGKWMHVVGTYNSDEGIMKIYYNGKLHSTNNIGQRTMDVSSAPIQIGGRATNMFNGAIDGVRLYGAAIPTSQIKDQYYSGLRRILANGNITKEDYQNRLLLSEENFSKK